MSLHFLAAAVGALIAAGGCGMLVARSMRAPNPAVVAWAVALAALTVSLGAQALGYDKVFTPTTFRAMALGSLAVAPLSLALGLSEVAAKGLATRFAARLILSAVALVSVIILATDPLSSATFTRVWPDPATYYQPIPNLLLRTLLPEVTVLVAVIAVATVALRQGREQVWRDAFLPVAAGAVAAIVLSVPGLAELAKVKLPLATAFVLLCVLAAAATWLAGVEASRLELGVMRGTAAAVPPRARRETGGFGEGTGGFGLIAEDDEFGIYRPSDSRRRDSALDRPAAGGDAGYPGQAGFRGEPGHGDLAGYADPDTGYSGGPGYAGDSGYPADSGYTAEAGYPADAGYPDEAGFAGEPGLGDQAGYPGETGYAGDTGYPGAGGYPDEAGFGHNGGYGEPGGGYPGEAGYQDGSPAQADGDSQLFGQIAIYTLLEDRVDDFDRLTKTVVSQVRQQEPDTLVYIVHAVPAAPMQRILYEVYRDRAAYEDHKRRPYVISFETDRRPFVLATNVIELGLQQAKVSPLPSVTDLLTDTGFDLVSDTGYGQPGYGRRHTPRHGGDAAGGGPAARSM